MWPGRPAAWSRIRRAWRSISSSGANRTTGSRFPWTATPGPSRSQASASSTRQSRPMTSPPASRWSSSSEPVSVPKWIDGDARVERREEPRHVRLDEPPVVVGPEVADPAIEELEHLGPGGGLGVEVDGRGVDQASPSGRPRRPGRGT